MSSRWIVAASVLLSGCSATEACDLLGDFVGSYQGDLEGELAATITENSDVDGEAVADFVLSGTDTDLYANGVVDCSSGALVVDLTDAGGASLGEVTGALTEGSGAGDWSLLTGESGTWSYGG